jgi:hypothetical protein
MTETTRDPEVAESENVDNGRTALNPTCSTTSKGKPLPDRGSWSTKLDFILSVVTCITRITRIMIFHVASCVNCNPRYQRYQCRIVALHRVSNHAITQSQSQSHWTCIGHGVKMRSNVMRKPLDRECFAIYLACDNSM